MRTLLMFSALALLLTSCNSVESLRAPIEGLATNWESTTGMVTDFVSTLQGTQSNLQNQFAQLQVPERMQLNEESTGKRDELKNAYQEQLAGLSTLSETVSHFVGDWQNKAKKVTELKDGLASGNLGSDALETVASLKETVTEATSGLEEWQGDLASIKENTSGLLEQFNSFIANMQGS